MTTGDRHPLGFVCSVDGCLAPATRRGHATIRTNPHGGRHVAIDTERHLRFELVFCDEHAAAMEEGGILVELDSGF
jgi:hypothetical protein